MTSQPLAPVGSLKVKLGLLVAASVVAAASVATLGRAGGVPAWLSLPVTVLLALALTQLLAVGMTSPLREMTAAASRMATGDYDVRVNAASRDEVGQLARAFNTMAQDLASVDRQRRELVANVSHELRTPLAGLCAVLENLVDGVGPRDPRTLVAALAQAERTAGLVEDLLDLARVDAGRAPLDTVDVPVRALLEEAVAEATVLGRDVDFRLRVAPPDLTVRADPRRLRQLVANLLDNAARHSPQGGSVRVSGARHADRFVLEVHDDGAGVPPAQRERLFEPFGTLSGDHGGTGLGLAIARWVTDLHRGTIGFTDPEPGRTGARVRVDLPLLAPSRAAATPPPAAAREAVVAPPLLDEAVGGFWPDRAGRGRPGLLLAAVAVGVMAGVVLPFRDLGLGTLLVLVAAGGVVLAASRHRTEPFTVTCAGLCFALAATSALRDAEWVVVPCLLAGAGLCVVGVTRGATLAGFLVSAAAWPLAGLRGLPWLGRTLAALTGSGRAAAVLRTAAWSVAGLGVFGALLASADALLAEWVDTVLPDLDLAEGIDAVVLRVFLAVAVGGAVLAAAYLGLNPPRVDRRGPATRPVARRFEWLAPVLVVVGVFAAFLAAQATVVFGGHGYLRRTTGLTYADYVHQGFGQLTAATALTLLVIWTAGRKAPRATSADRVWLRASLGVLCVETLVVVASALHRMHVYQEAYGFTRLRLLVDVFEGWLGVLLVAVLISGVTLRAAWLPRFALLSGVLALLGLAAVNPDAWIAEHNLDRYAETGRVDWTYLQGLSDDAVPVLADLPPELARCALAGRAHSDGDWLEWNLGRSRAADAWAGAESPGPGPTPTVEACQDR